MADTHGFDIVAEASVTVLKELMKQAWKSGGWKPGDPATSGVINESFNIEPGPIDSSSTIMLSGGHVQNPQNESDLKMETLVNGVDMKFGLHIQILIQNPPVPSAGLFNLTAEVHAKTPIGVIDPAKNNVGVLLSGLPQGNVTVDLTSGDPVDPQIETFIKEYVDHLYVTHVLPQQSSQANQPIGFGAIANIDSVISDDNNDPNHQITVKRLNANTPNEAVDISIPIFVEVSHIRNSPIPLADPMGIEARMVIHAKLNHTPGSYTLKLSDPGTTVSVDPKSIVPAPGDLGQHYTDNKKTLAFVNLDDLMAQQIAQQGQKIVANLASSSGDPQFQFPTVPKIKTFIHGKFYDELTKNGSLIFWNPSPGPLVVKDVATRALADAVVIAINQNPGADLNGFSKSFLPAGSDFAIAVRGQFVLDKMNQAISAKYGSDLSNHPFVFPDVHGHKVELKGLSPSLVDGAMHFDGDVTVIDAILGKFDVSASFTDDCGLMWMDDPNSGGQNMVPLIADPDFSVGLLAWIISLLVGILTGGVGGGIIGAIIGAIIKVVVEHTVESIGSDFVKDQIGTIFVLSPWPKQVPKIGTVDSRYDGFIGISPDGLLFSGRMHVKSAFALVPVVFADAQAPSTAVGGLPVTIKAGQTDPSAGYAWELGDGGTAATPTVSHIYAKSGIYLAHLALTVNLPGGNFSRQFAMIKVANTPPVVKAPPNRTINEGDVVAFSATFTDQQWPDTHQALWNWDDYQGPSVGIVSETNNPPAAQGTVTGSHAWGDAGIYTGTIQVRDDVGGIGRDTFQVTVLNVPPKVDAGPPLFAYPCSVITLEGKFTDPGWQDSHTGSWDFGDCTPPFPAVMDETHDPPAGKGVARASHVYMQCGMYRAICVVMDDDGGVGQDTTTISVVDVENADFEGGFRGRLSGVVANGWEPYTAAPPELPGTAASGTAVPSGGTFFYAEEFRVHSGERSQRIRGESKYRAGIYQQIGANPGWDYQISAWYSISERPEEKGVVSSDPAIEEQQEEMERIRAAGTARLGMDPEGGTDPTAPGVVWVAGKELKHWNQLSVRAGAKAQAVTIFLEAIGDDRITHEVCFDDLALLPIQPFCPGELPRPEKVCLDFSDLKPGQEIKPGFVKSGFRTVTPDQLPRFIVSFGLPAGQNKLELLAGVLIDLPFPADDVEIEEFQTSDRPVEVTGLDAQGFPVAQASSLSSFGAVQTLKMHGPGMVRVEIKSRGTEALLIQICASRTQTDPGKERDQ